MMHLNISPVIRAYEAHTGFDRRPFSCRVAQSEFPACPRRRQQAAVPCVDVTEFERSSKGLALRGERQQGLVCPALVQTSDGLVLMIAWPGKRGSRRVRAYQNH